MISPFTFVFTAAHIFGWTAVKEPSSASAFLVPSTPNRRCDRRAGRAAANTVAASLATVTTATSTTATASSTTTTAVRMIGGRGWDNNDYLSSLSGDEEDRKNSSEDYRDFSDRRAAFHARQEAIMKTPEGQAFLKQREEAQFRQLRQQEEGLADGDDGDGGDGFAVEESSGGGTRMGRMMAQAKRMQEQRLKSQTNPMLGGFQQQLLGPLDDDNGGSGSVSNDNDNGETGL